MDEKTEKQLIQFFDGKGIPFEYRAEIHEAVRRLLTSEQARLRSEVEGLRGYPHFINGERVGDKSLECVERSAVLALLPPKD